jgi:hypothetical protein
VGNTARDFFATTLAAIALMYHPLWREEGFDAYAYAGIFVKCTYISHLQHVVGNSCFCSIYKSVELNFVPHRKHIPFPFSPGLGISMFLLYL